MIFSITKPDPFNILASTKGVLEEAKFVAINQKAVESNVTRIGGYLKQHADFPDFGHRLTGNFEADLQLIFFESMMGFCFWTIPGKPKWGIEMSDGERVDGWYGVCASFKRAYDEGTPVGDANFFAKADRKDVQNKFRSATGAEIPLLDERVAILNENARVLNEHFGGKTLNLLEAADRDVIKLLHLLLQCFPSYRDVATYNAREVVFLKIAHLLALDLEYRLTPQSQRPFLKNFDQLCVFADYKLPQLLRAFGVLEYKQSLADTVDSYTIIPKGSEQEVEIRSGAIWGVELLRQQLPEYSSVQVGHVIWLLSQDQELQSKIKPYHRTHTTFY
ncbi:MAG: hypothetical protein A3G10_02790 [Candidatus Wildermuthbacteria bacterium RIFCSPLOWO2_12_FULL_49_9]|nr:MAG: hypothetical protein A3G10_02790 [Candidatus Wildermuthbacteria bacterium RIFCSPLOWO2_12_FULL_49_9]